MDVMEYILDRDVRNFVDDIIAMFGYTPNFREYDDEVSYTINFVSEKYRLYSDYTVWQNAHVLMCVDKDNIDEDCDGLMFEMIYHNHDDILDVIKEVRDKIKHRYD